MPAWETVGTEGFSAGTASYVSLAISSSGTPYVAYNDGTNGSKATVKTYDGTSWVTVGNAAVSAGIANYESLAISPSGTPYVAYNDGTNGSKATVKTYDLFIEVRCEELPCINSRNHPHCYHPSPRSNSR